MSTSAILLLTMSVVAISDIAFALYFRSVADRVESGEITREGFDPAGARRMATMLLIGAPLFWIVTVLICFNIIPAGLGPVQF